MTSYLKPVFLVLQISLTTCLIAALGFSISCQPLSDPYDSESLQVIEIHNLAISDRPRSFGILPNSKAWISGPDGKRLANFKKVGGELSTVKNRVVGQKSRILLKGFQLNQGLDNTSPPTHPVNPVSENCDFNLQKIENRNGKLWMTGIFNSAGSGDGIPLEGQIFHIKSNRDSVKLFAQLLCPNRHFLGDLNNAPLFLELRITAKALEAKN